MLTAPHARREQAPVPHGRRLVLPAGDEVLVRPLTAADREIYTAAVNGLSAETRYLRFASPKPSLTDAEIDYLIDVDHHDHEALAALHPVTGEGLAVVRFVRLADDPARADVAVTVTDRWQGRGLAGALLELLAARAREEGVRIFTATTLRENRRALRLLRRFGFQPVAAAGEMVDLELALA
jgi:RimJ/RimL family protein N-acetyltransferase